MTHQQVAPGRGAGCRCARTGRSPGPSARRPRGRRGSSARPDTMISGGMPSKAARRQRPAADGQQHEAQDAAAGEAQQAVPVAPPDGEALGRAERHPGPVAGQVLGQLAAQHEHGAEVLQRDREAELADQGGAALGLLQRHPAEQREAGDGEARRRRPRRPGRSSAPGAARGRGCRGSWWAPARPGTRRGPPRASTRAAEDRGHPSPQPDAARPPWPTPMNRAPIERAACARPEPPQAQQRAAQPTAGELAADGADDGAQEGGVAQRARRRRPGARRGGRWAPGGRSAPRPAPRRAGRRGCPSAGRGRGRGPRRARRRPGRSRRTSASAAASTGSSPSQLDRSSVTTMPRMPVR